MPTWQNGKESSRAKEASNMTRRRPSVLGEAPKSRRVAPNRPRWIAGRPGALSALIEPENLGYSFYSLGCITYMWVISPSGETVTPGTESVFGCPILPIRDW
jgi:hypothetical protein